MNILFIIPSLRGGGAEKVTTLLASELSNDNNIYLVAYQEKDNPYPISPNVKIIYLNLYGGNKLKKIKNSFKRIKLLKQIKKAYNIDCSISMLLMPNFENVLSKMKDKIIISIRNNSSLEMNKIEKRINTYSSKKADLTITLSKAIEIDQINNFKCPQNKVLTIYNPCDINLIENLSSKYVTNNQFNEIRQKSSIIFITAGRLSIQKGQWHLISSFRRVVQMNKNACLIILGEGELYDDLKKYIDYLGLHENVYLFGFVSNPYYYMSKCDVFVFSSLFEGFGNILLEAMACRLPIISADCEAGPRELLNDGQNGDLVENFELCKYGVLTKRFPFENHIFNDEITEEEASLSNAMIYMMNNPIVKEKYASSSMSRIYDFSIERIVKKWKEIL